MRSNKPTLRPSVAALIMVAGFMVFEAFAVIMISMDHVPFWARLVRVCSCLGLTVLSLAIYGVIVIRWLLDTLRAMSPERRGMLLRFLCESNVWWIAKVCAGWAPLVVGGTLCYFLQYKPGLVLYSLPVFLFGPFLAETVFALQIFFALRRLRREGNARSEDHPADEEAH